MKPYFRVCCPTSGSALLTVFAQALLNGIEAVLVVQGGGVPKIAEPLGNQRVFGGVKVSTLLGLLGHLSLQDSKIHLLT